MILLCHGHYIFGLASSMCATIIVSAWWHDDKTHSPVLSNQYSVYSVLNRLIVPKYLFSPTI